MSAERPRDIAVDYPLSRLTTIRTGGHGDFYLRPHSSEMLANALAWADAEGIEVGVVGSGSNLLIADAGFRGLVMKLDGSLATIEQDGERLLCGGGARLPQAAAFAARAGLTGLEFGVNIPGTVGGARFSEKHANFVENMGEATTADVIALMGEGRRRVRERFGVELEPEVQFLGEVDATPLWGSP